MKSNLAYRLTVGGNGELRQYHLYSRRVLELYIQTYTKLGKEIKIEQLINGLWQPAAV